MDFLSFLAVKALKALGPAPSVRSIVLQSKSSSNLGKIKFLEVELRSKMTEKTKHFKNRMKKKKNI